MMSFSLFACGVTAAQTTSPLVGPPKVASVEGIKKDRRAPFDEHVEIRCVLYTGGTGWKAPDAEAKTCDELVRLTLHPDARRN